MKSKILITKITALVFAILVLSSCKDFLDINDNPNSPSDVPLNQLLPSVELNAAFVTGNSGGMNGHLGTMMHHYVQRGNLNDYGAQGTDFNIAVVWNSNYTGSLTDIREMKRKATEEEKFHYLGIAEIIQVFLFSHMVDVWGDIPYFDANAGFANAYPSYDDDAAIYADLISQLDVAIANLAKGGPLPPGADDVIYGGDLAKWRRFAKSLKFKMLVQTRLVNDVQAEINQLITEDDMLRSTGEDDFQLDYGTSFAPENRNPGFAQEYAKGGANYYISPYFYEVMRSQDTFNHGGIQFGVPDPRIPYYFFNQLPAGSLDGDAENPCAYCPSNSGTSFLSIYAFSFNIDPNEGFSQASSQTIAGLYPLGGRFDDGLGGVASNASTLAAGDVTGPGTVPHRMLTYLELEYLKAELAQEGVIGSNARTHLESAIRASFAKVNEIAGNASAPTMDAATIDGYTNAVLGVYDAPPAGFTQLEIIMTQKWIATFGNALNTYNDYRRTGFPRLHDGNTDNLNVTKRSRDFPVSMPYEDTDLTINPNAPKQRVIATDRIFWDN